jgi:hypothetical protein
VAFYRAADRIGNLNFASMFSPLFLAISEVPAHPRAVARRKPPCVHFNQKNHAHYNYED